MMLQTNFGNAMTIINNTAHSLAQSEALVAWVETRRLALNAMKPNKPFQKHQVKSILLVMAMCWASQSSAQPTRASVIVAQAQPQSKNFTIGVCKIIETSGETDGIVTYPQEGSASWKSANALAPIDAVGNYLWEQVYHANSKSEIDQDKVRTILDRKSTRLNSSHLEQSRMPSSA